jgi:hypothetical protein
VPGPVDSVVWKPTMDSWKLCRVEGKQTCSARASIAALSWGVVGESCFCYSTIQGELLLLLSTIQGELLLLLSTIQGAMARDLGSSHGAKYGNVFFVV